MFSQQTSPLPGHSPLLPISQMPSLLLISKSLRTCSIGCSLNEKIYIILKIYIEEFVRKELVIIEK